MAATPVRVPYDPTLRRYIRESDPAECKAFGLCEICSTIDFHQISLIDPTTVRISDLTDRSTDLGFILPVFQYPSIISLSEHGCTLCDMWRKSGDFIPYWLNPGQRPGIALSYEIWPPVVTEFQPLIRLVTLYPQRYKVAYFGRSFYWCETGRPLLPDGTATRPLGTPDYRWLQSELACYDPNPEIAVRYPKPCGMRFINCHTHRIVPAPQDAPYLALSYVWGSRPSAQRPRARDGEIIKPSLTIDDAMALTLRLGKTFLWVDYYCIEQDDEHQKDKQLASMVSIYARAWATIVGFGPDNKHGLPGISRVQSEVLRVSTSQGLLVSTNMVDQEYDMSAWLSRAWTMQEAGLSQQLLLMTGTKAAISRHSGFWLDAPSWLPEACQWKYRQPRKHSSQSDTFNPQELRPWDLDNAPNYRDVMRDYCSRKLSFEQDALNALRGYLETLPCASYWGIPVLLPQAPVLQVRNGTAASSDDILAGFCAGLSWKTDNMLCDDRPRLGPGSEGTLTSIQTFPSWSWASSGRRVARMETALKNQGCEGVPQTWSISLCDINIVLADGELVHVSSFLNPSSRPRARPEENSLLEIHVTLLEYTVQSLDNGFQVGILRQINEGLGLDSFGWINADWGHRELGLAGGWTIPLVAFNESETTMCKMYMLIIQKVGEIWQRAGLIEYCLTLDASPDFARRLTAWLQAQPTANTRILLG